MFLLPGQTSPFSLQASKAPGEVLDCGLILDGSFQYRTMPIGGTREKMKVNLSVESVSSTTQFRPKPPLIEEYQHSVQMEKKKTEW